MLAFLRRGSWWFGVGILALGVRMAYVLGTAPRHLPFSDSFYYQLLAIDIAHGHGFVNPFILLTRGQSIPGAAHPPLYPLVLAAASVIGGTSVQAHQLLGCAIGTVTVLAIGLVAAHIAGRRAGLCAGLLAAIYPPLWLNDGGIDVEGLYALVIAVMLIASYAFLDKPSPRRALLLGSIIGLAALTRADAASLIVLLVVPLIWSIRRQGLKRAGKLFGLTVFASMAVLSPWEIRNLVTFQRPVLISTDDSVLGAANCNLAYHSRLIGLWSSKCFLKHPPHGDESVVAAAEAEKGLKYVERHLTEVPEVVVVRIARVWQVYRPIQDAMFSAEDGRPTWTIYVGVIGFYAILPLAVAGMVVLRRRRVRILPLNAQLAEVTLTAALSWGAIRFQAPADVVLVVLGGVALGAANDGFIARRTVQSTSAAKDQRV